MQRLRAAEDRRHRLQRGAHDVVLRLLRRERRAAGLGVEPQHRARGSFAPNRSVMIRAHMPPGGPELRDLLEEVHVAREEEREPRREVVDRQPGVDRRLHVGDGVGQRERDLLRPRSRPPRACGSR